MYVIGLVKLFLKVNAHLPTNQNVKLPVAMVLRKTTDIFVKECQLDIAHAAIV